MNNNLLTFITRINNPIIKRLKIDYYEQNNNL